MKLRSVVNVMLVLGMAGAVPGVGSGVSQASGQDAIAIAIAEHVGILPVAEDRGPSKIKPESLGVWTNAPSVVIRDVESGVKLFSRDAESVRSIASITKLMTALVLVDEYEWDLYDDATVLREDVIDGGRWRFSFGDELTMDDLFTMMLVASGNNEAMAMVREVGATRDEFVDKMNEKAREIGMTDSHFAGPIGLDPRNRSSAFDVEILLREALSRDLIAKKIGRDRVVVDSGTGRHYSVESTNKLFGTYLDVGANDVIGGKTGSLDEAGYCVTTRVSYGGNLLDVTVLGASYPAARFNDVKAMVNWAGDVYEW